MRFLFSNSICSKLILSEVICSNGRAFLVSTPCLYAEVKKTSFSLLAQNKINTDSKTLVVEIGEEYKKRWNKLMELPRKIKNDKHFIGFEKKKLHIDESIQLETFLKNHFLNSNINVFNLHLAM
jgi:hypothetical protein